MGKLYGLEALRGLAAITVVWQHICQRYGYEGLFTIIVGKGHLAVDLFFLISGFVLARTYEKAMPRPVDFLVMRYRRLWAPLAGGAVIAFLFALYRGEPLLSGAALLVAGLAMMPGRGFHFALNPPAWSIFFELVANVVHAWLLVRLGKLGLVLIVVGAALLMWPIMWQRGFDVGHDSVFWWGLPRVMLSYTLGVLLFRLNGDRVWLPVPAAWLVAIAYPVAIGSFAATSPLGEMAFAVVVHPLLLLAVLAMPRNRLALWLGAFSFPLYALHSPLMEADNLLAMHWSAGLAVCLGGSALIGLALDPRWRKLVLGQFRRPATLPPVVGPALARDSRVRA